MALFLGESGEFSLPTSEGARHKAKWADYLIYFGFQLVIGFK